MYRSGGTFEQAAEAHHAVVSGTAAAGTDGNGGGKPAFTVLPGGRGDKVLAHRYLGVIKIHKMWPEHIWSVPALSQKTEKKGNKARERTSGYSV